MGEFDKLFDQLHGDAAGLLKERVGELARAATPVERP
jgi:hypothetical protein